MRIALGIEYHGGEFSGWQAQANKATVQGCLEQSLTTIADHPIKLYCAGRTDAGVHAMEQIVHFDTDAIRQLRAWVWGTNTHLPGSIAVRWAHEVDDEFHARFSAISRTYRYFIHNHSVRSALTMGRATWYHHPLDINPMQTAASYLIGEQDFSSFRSSECESKTPMRNIHYINVTQQGDMIMIEICANAFLHHMVRNITGVLLKIGSGVHAPDWMLEVLQAKDRRKAAETALPDGLYLYKVSYPDKYQLPQLHTTHLF